MKGYDCGDDIAQWLNTFLNADHRLVCYTNDLKPRNNNEYEKRATADDKVTKSLLSIVTCINVATFLSYLCIYSYWVMGILQS